MGIETKGKREEGAPSISPLEKKIARVLQRERKPSKIELQLLLGPHGLTEHVEWMSAEIANADVILLENASRTFEMEENFNKISLGEMSVEKAKALYRVPFVHGIIDRIAGTKKAIGFHDVKDTAATSKEMEIAFEAYNRFPEKSLADGPPYEEALRRYESVMREYARVDREREKQILATIHRTIARTIEHTPGLRMKPEIRVAMLIGVGHSNMAADFETLHPATQAHVAPGHEELPMWSQLQQAMKMSSSYAPELVERGMFEGIALGYMDVMVREFSIEEIAPLLQKIFNSFSIEDIRAFYELVRQPHLAAQTPRAFIRERALPIVEAARAQEKS